MDDFLTTYGPVGCLILFLLGLFIYGFLGGLFGKKKQDRGMGGSLAARAGDELRTDGGAVMGDLELKEKPNAFLAVVAGIPIVLAGTGMGTLCLVGVPLGFQATWKLANDGTVITGTVVSSEPQTTRRRGIVGYSTEFVIRGKRQTVSTDDSIQPGAQIRVVSHDDVNFVRHLPPGIEKEDLLWKSLRGSVFLFLFGLGSLSFAVYMGRQVYKILRGQYRVVPSE